MAAPIASVRPVTLSFSSMWVTCTLTVPSLMLSATPISLLLLPLASARITSISRAVKDRSVTRLASFAPTAGGIQVLPSPTCGYIR